MLTIRKRGKYFHVRGSIRVGRETRIIKEHSCGTDRRDAKGGSEATCRASCPPEGRLPTAPFRTIQDCLNELPATLWQAERAAAWLRELLVVTPGREAPCRT